MEWWVFLLIFFGGLLFFMSLGIPVGKAFLCINFFFLAFFVSLDAGGKLLIQGIFHSLTSFIFIAIPLYLFMGELLFKSGMAGKAIDVISLWIGRLPGRLSVIAIAGGAVLGALSGSAMASTSLLGSSLSVEMRNRGYHTSMIVGPILASSGLAMLIPPSAMAIFLAAIACVPVRSLLIAGIVPGLLMAALYFLYVVVRCLIRPELTPPYQIERISLREKMLATLKESPILLIVLAVVGAIVLGLTTPTEAAALGVICSLVLACIRKRMSLKLLQESALGTLKTTGMVFFILVGSIGYSQLLGFTGATRSVVRFVLGYADSGLLIIILMQILVLVLGMFLDQSGIIMLTIPLYMPVITELGYDPIWFLIMYLINLQIATTTPPVGILLFVIKGVLPFKVHLSDIYKSAVPFICCDVVCMILIMFFPMIVTFIL